MKNIWNSTSSRRIFGWKDILRTWKNNHTTPHAVECILDNLRGALNPSSTYSPRVSQFLTFLNNEQEGIAWFLFECISLRWMWGDIHLEYVRELVDEIDNLDTQFPAFPGSPNCTIRKFVTDNLSADELDYIQMMPPLEEELLTPLRNPPRIQRSVPAAPSRQEPLLENNAVDASRGDDCNTLMQIRLIRNINKKDIDEVVNIKRNSITSLFEVRHFDRSSGLHMNNYSMTSDAVIRHMKLFLRMLTVDEEPYTSVQFSLPCMPTILVSPKNLTSQTRDMIYDSMALTMESWPVVY